MQMEAFQRKSASLQKVINKLTLRLFSKEQDMQLRMFLGVDGCGPPMNTPPATLQSADVGRSAPYCTALLGLRSAT